MSIFSLFRACKEKNRPLERAYLDGSAGVAQLVEHVIRNDGVGSSNLFSGTIEVFLKNSASL